MYQLLLNSSIEFEPEAWSDEEEIPGAPLSSSTPADLADSLRRIKILEEKLTDAQRDLIDYRNLVNEQLDVARLAEIVDEPMPPAKPATDDDSHYFDTYSLNGMFSLFMYRANGVVSDVHPLQTYMPL